ncbi:MAG: trimeric intracellular cation channel family protein [Acidimicrobiales bacterium]
MADVTPDLTTAIPFWVETVAIGAGAVAGSLRAVRERLAISGVVALAVAVGLGGGIIRDTLLQAGVPVALREWWFLPIVLIAAAGAIVLRPLIDRLWWPVFATDSLSIGLYTVLGAAKALRYDVPPVGAILVGVLAGTGGSMLADLFVGVPPVLFRPGPLLGVSAAVGASTFVAGATLTGHRNAWFVVGVTLATVARIVSVATGRGVGPADRYEDVMRQVLRGLGRPRSTDDPPPGP